MGDITFVKGQGGLERTLPGEDHYSGLLYYVADAVHMPSGWEAGAPQQILSLKDLESKNILETTPDFEVLHYHVGEFFRINPGGVLYVCIQKLDIDGNTTFGDIATLGNAAGGKLRQTGVFAPVIFKGANIGLIQGVVNNLETEHKPLSVLLNYHTEEAISIGDLLDLRDSNARKVSVVIGQDGAAKGRELFDAGKFPSCLGAALGAVSLAQVHQNIGWVGRFNVAEVELDEPALVDGRPLSALTENDMTALNAKAYVFVRKHIGITGSYFNDSPTCVDATSDYAYIENNRTIDKAIRGVRTYLLPELNAPVSVDPDTGKLSGTYCRYLEEKGGQALKQMQQAGETSGYKVFVDPDQNVLSTSKIEVVISIVPKGVSRNIEVTIGFTLKLD